MTENSIKKEVPLPENSIACEAISNKLTNITKLAESVDCAFRNTQLGFDKVDIEPKTSDELATVEVSGIKIIITSFIFKKFFYFFFNRIGILV